jgi:pimeloyl-ACP methyl ester carboxylesterase
MIVENLCFIRVQSVAESWFRREAWIGFTMNRKALIVLCLLLAASPTLHGQQNAARRDLKRPMHLLVVLIGGVDSDPTAAQIAGTAERHEGNSGLYRLAGDLARERVLPEYFNWNGTRAGNIQDKDPPRSRGIAEFIRMHLQKYPGDRVAIVGNSWGGHTALEVLQTLSTGEGPVAVDLVVFLDASSTGRGPARPNALPICVNQAVSYFTRNAFVWGKWNAGTRLKNIDLGDPVERFLIRGGPAYDARFNLPAHVAAEWDENIHTDVQARLLDLL